MSLFGYYHSSYSSDDSLSGYWIIGGIAVIIGILWVWSAISSQIERKAKEISDRAIEARKAEVDNHQAQRKKEADQYQKDTLHVIAGKQMFLDGARTQFDRGYIAGRRWLAECIANAETARDQPTIDYLRYKSHPAAKASDYVKTASLMRREAIEKLKFLEYQLASYKEYFPILAEYEEIILDEIAGFKRGNDIDDTNENIDRSALYLSKEEYQKLPPTERNQRALDAYKVRNKSPWEIGRLYERYLGYLYEMDDWDVNFHGALKGFEDMGRDLICTKKEKTHIVQAKCWSKEKVIHEKHLFQLYGTCLLYEILEQKSVAAIFVTTAQLSDVATLAAKRLNVVVRNQKLENAYPQIKCNINQGNRIYHLPFDQQYDRVKIRPSEGEFYALSVVDAEAKGFRRAKRHMPQASSA
jgi:Restriction endonuclease